MSKGINFSLKKKKEFKLVVNKTEKIPVAMISFNGISTIKGIKGIIKIFPPRPSNADEIPIMTPRMERAKTVITSQQEAE